jgi:hypothetical protein
VLMHSWSSAVVLREVSPELCVVKNDTIDYGVSRR